MWGWVGKESSEIRDGIPLENVAQLSLVTRKGFTVWRTTMATADPRMKLFFLLKKLNLGEKFVNKISAFRCIIEN